MHLFDSLGPVYHTLERDATPPRGSDVYEMPFDSTDNKTQEKLPATEKAESSYAALEEKPLQKNENTYEPLALERERKKPGSEKHDKKGSVGLAVVSCKFEMKI